MSTQQLFKIIFILTAIYVSLNADRYQCYEEIKISDKNSALSRAKALYDDSYKKDIYEKQYHNVYVDIKIDSKLCNKNHPLLVDIINKSNSSIEAFSMSIGSWLEKSSGQSYFIEGITHSFQDSIETDFYIKPNQSFHFCSKAPNELWEYKKKEGASFMSLIDKGDKVKLVKKFSIYKLKYAVYQSAFSKVNCYIKYSKN